MPFRVLPDGSIVADTPQEALLLSEAIRARAAIRVRHEAAMEPHDNPSPEADEAESPLVHDFPRFPPQQMRLLRVVQRDGPVTLAQLRAALGLDSNNAVTGVLSGIVKNLSRIGWDSSLVLVRRPVMHDGHRTIAYEAGPDLANAVLPEAGEVPALLRDEPDKEP